VVDRVPVVVLLVDGVVVDRTAVGGTTICNQNFALNLKSLKLCSALASMTSHGQWKSINANKSHYFFIVLLNPVSWNAV
jgi:hypothetical protein